MNNLVFIKELLTVVGSVTAILIALGSLILFIIKKAFERGEGYQLFKNLVKKVSAIEALIEDKFFDNDNRHKKHEEKLQVHESRITTLEVVDSVRQQKAQKN